MKIIDILIKIKNDEEVPKKIKVFNDIYEYDSFNKTYWNSNNINLFAVYNGSILTYEAEIIEDKPKEDKKIERIGNDYYHKTIYEVDQLFQRKINEIIDYLNSEK